MKFCKFAAVGVLSFAAVLGAQAPASQQSAQQSQPATQQNPQPAKTNGKVLFSRSLDENGDTQTEAPGQAEQGAPLAKAPVADDAERAAVTFTSYDLDVRLRTDEHRMAVRALLTVRNDGTTPLKRIPLQISSTLNWERVRVAGKEIPFQAAVLNSDADHTGQLHEAAIPLPEPLAPGATVRVDVAYSGVIEVSAQRLLAMGTPEDVAQRSDWDRIDTAFTGLRGFGNVVWYPVSAVPVVLGDGARLFDEIGEQKRRMAGAKFRLRLTAEFPHGQPPTIALVNGRVVDLKVTDSATAGEDVPGVATAELSTALGFEAPSLFVAIRNAHAGTNLTAWTRTEDDAFASSWTQAEKGVTLFMQRWLGDKPRTQLTLLDLPEVDDAPFETGALLATGIQDADPEQLKAILAHGLAHSWVALPDGNAHAWLPAWLDEGMAYFISTLWMEQQQGREKALEMLESGRQALALAEPASPGQGSGELLGAASTPAYYRTKAAYVLWMLREMTSDDALAAALRGDWSVPLETRIEKAANTDLKWFFADWVDADHGLPDLSIDDVFSSAEQSGNWLVVPHLSNAGYAAVEVPVVVRSASGTVITQRVRVPARDKAAPRILIQGRPIEVQVNDGTVPETSASVHVTKVAPPAPAPLGQKP